MDGEALHPVELEPGIWLLDLAGELTGEDDERLDRALAPVLGGNASALVLNFVDLAEIDGGGFGLLVKLGVRVGRRRVRLAAFGLRPRCRALFEQLGLGSVISFHSSPAKALREAGSRKSAALATRQGEREACPAAHWAGVLGRARVSAAGAGESGLNVEGLGVQGPFDGFGKLWQKVYSLRMAGVSVAPAEVVKLCAERLNDFWPPGNCVRFPAPGVVPGAIGLIELRMPGGMPLKTGMRVLHAAERSFTFVPLQGHMEAGLITFSAREHDGCTVFQVESLARTGDPLYELGFRLFGHSEQERFWRATLAALARHYGVAPEVRVSSTCLDEGLRWARAPNVAANAAARTGLYFGASLLSRLFSPRQR